MITTISLYISVYICESKLLFFVKSALYTIRYILTFSNEVNDIFHKSLSLYDFIGGIICFLLYTKFLYQQTLYPTIHCIFMSQLMNHPIPRRLKMFDNNKITPRHQVNRLKISTRQVNLPVTRRKLITKTPYLYIVFRIPGPI